MFTSRNRPLNWAGLIALAVALTLAFAPAVAARSGGGGGGRGRGGFGGGDRGYSAPSMNSRSDSHPSYSAPRGGGFSAPRSEAPMRSAPSFSTPRMNAPAPQDSPRVTAPSRPTNREFYAPRTYSAPSNGGFSMRDRGSMPAQQGMGPGTGNVRNTFDQPRGMPDINGRGNRDSAFGNISKPNNSIGERGRDRGTQETAPGIISGRGSSESASGEINKPNTGVGDRGRDRGTPGTVPGIGNGRGDRGSTNGGLNNPNAIGGRGRGDFGQAGRGHDPGFGIGQARQQWNQTWNHDRGNWRRDGDWDRDDHRWNWNRSRFSAGFFFYPSFAFGFRYGYWAFDYYDPFCSYSPFFYYGYPYVYAPRVVVIEVPVYTYAAAPDYDYGNGYYLSRGSYSGFDAALRDIRSAWVNDRADLLLKHIDAGTQVDIYLDDNYSYSLPGSDYSDMAQDAIGHIRTVSFTFDNVEQRSDGAYTATGTHDFYDANDDHKVVTVSFTLKLSNGRWVITAAGSSER